MPPISLRHIEIFHAVMTAGNLTEAAALLNTSQPTVSRELARLETLLQLRLFDRVRGRLHPTSEGLRLYEEVQRSYYGLDRIINAAESIKQFQQAQISIVCLPMFSQFLLPQVCHKFIEQYPDTSFSIVPQESPILEEWLTAQRHDIGLSENTLTPPGTVGKTVLTIDEVCIMPKGHSLTASQCLTPQDFSGQNFISFSATDPYRQLLDSLFHQHHVQRRMVAETHSASSVCAMVAQGIGLSIVNPLTALDYQDKLTIRPFSLSVPFTVSIIQPLHRPSSMLVERFIEFVEQEIAHLPKQLRLVNHPE